MTAQRATVGGRLIIIGGPPASGKSTLAARLEEATGAVRLSPDEWMGVLGAELLDSETRDGVEALQWDLARTLLRHSLTVLLDWGVFSRDKRDVLREGARTLDAAVELHFLSAPAAMLWSRIEQRRAAGDPSQPSREQLAAMLDELEAPGRAELALFDAPACPSVAAG